MNDAPASAPAAEGELVLDEFERALVLPRIQSFIDAAADDAARAALTELRDAAADGAVAAHLQSRLGAIVDVALASGVVRRESGPAAAHALAALYRRTPRGRAVAASVDSLNSALNTLAGNIIDSISATMRSPGVYALKIRTGQVEMVISLAPSGAAVESLEVAID